MNPYEKKLAEKIKFLVTEEDLKKYTEGFCLQVYHKGKKKGDLKVGKTYNYYDLASLTKVMFTVSACLRLTDESPHWIKKPVAKLVPDWSSDKKLYPVNLLNHTAGFPWWRPFYEKIDRHASRESRWEFVQQQIHKISQKRRPKSVYSDIGFLILGDILKHNFAKPLFNIWEEIQDQLSLEHTHFHLNNSPVYKRDRYAPTEDCPWRKKVLQGEVHDENTWALGGVSSHAGLFGPVDDVSRWALFFRNAYYNKKGSPLSSKKAARRFARRSTPMAVGDFGLGFMKPTVGKASCGGHFSPSSVGHTGFTGTSVWFDPQKDLIVTLLSNRIYPSRENKKFVTLRPKIHNCVWEALKDKK